MADTAERLVYLNGEFVPERDAKISIFDSALMFGDMVFEMTRSFNGKQFKLREHMERMFRGIKQLQIPIAQTVEEMEDLCYKTMEMNQPAFSETDEHRLMINVSRGPLSMYKAAVDGRLEPTVVIADFPVKWTVAPLAHFFDDGIHAVTPSQRAIPAQLLEPKIKNRSRIHYMVANLQVSLVSDPNAWALLLDPDGYVAEGTGSNFFIVKDGTLLTPEPRNVLRGTRRAFVLELAGKLGISAKECNLEPYDVASADEAFFTSTAFTMLPCTKFNGLHVGDGNRGPIFGKILKAFSEAVGVDIEAQTRTFAAEVGGELSGTNIYKFSR
ncbi:MAG: aminotransferase class IV [Armatimonadota bacterium]